MSIIFDSSNKKQSEILQKLDDKFLNGDFDNKHIEVTIDGISFKGFLLIDSISHDDFRMTTVDLRIKLV